MRGTVMTLNLYGLKFHVHSPSHYTLLDAREDERTMGDRVHICFTGVKWMIAYEYKNGHIARRLFNSRDAAMCMIANRACQ